MSTQDPNAPAQDGEDAGAIPPATEPAPSAAAPVVPPAASEEETVTVKKSDFEAMKGRQSVLDKKEERLARREKALARGGSFAFKQPTPQPAPAPSNDDDGNVEDEKAKGGLINLALKPEYRAALDADPTFRDLLTKNPLALLPIYAADAFDAEDAVSLMTEELERRAQAITPAPAAPAAPAPAAPVVPPAGAVSMSDGAVAEAAKNDPEYKEAIKGGTVKNIAAGIAHRLGSRGKHQ